MYRTLFPLLGALALAPLAPTQEVVPQPVQRHHQLVYASRSARALAHGPVQVTASRAHVDIRGQVATTTLDLDLHNIGRVDQEAELLIPVPDGAAVTRFEISGKADAATTRLLPADRALAEYNSIVARLKDPGLLEFAGHGSVRTSVFPVTASATMTVRLQYTETLRAEEGRVDYELPRSAAPQSVIPLELRMVVAGKPLAVYSPTHGLRETGRTPAGRTLELAPGAGAEPGHFRCSILTSETGFAGSLLACPDLDGSGGTFLLFAGLDEQASQTAPIPREVTLVLDRSGSMAGEKFDQARAAAIQLLHGLRPGELFRIVDYSVTAEAHSASALVKSPESLASARDYLNGLTTGGGTNIGAALGESLRPTAAARTLPIVLFLTDGLPTQGEVTEAGLRNIALQVNTHQRRLFAFGVGDDVNAPLLDSLSISNKGTTTYVRPGEDVEVAVGDLFDRLDGPQLADLAIEVFGPDGTIDTTLMRDLMPRDLPDLYTGDQLVLVGRYSQARPLELRLTGRAADGQRSYRIRGDLRKASPRHDFVPRLWASRRIAELTDSIRLVAGDGVNTQALLADPRTQELTEEILRLSVQHGVLSEFTSFLALEGTELNSWSGLATNANGQVVVGNTKHRWGAQAVNTARNSIDLGQRQQQSLTNAYWRGDDTRVQVGGARPISRGVLLQRGQTYVQGSLIDSYEGDTLPPAEREVTQGDEAYLQLSRELVQDGRADVLSIHGELLLEHRGKVLRLRNGECPSADAPQAPAQQRPQGHNW